MKPKNLSEVKSTDEFLEYLIDNYYFHQLKYDHDVDTTPEYIFDETSGNFNIKSN